MEAATVEADGGLPLRQLDKSYSDALNCVCFILGLNIT